MNNLARGRLTILPPWDRLLAGLVLVLLFAMPASADTVERDDLRLPHPEMPWPAEFEVASVDGAISAAALAGNQEDFDVLHYDLRLTPYFEAEALTGQVRIEFISLVDGLDRLDLDLYDTMVVTNALQNGAPAQFEHLGERLTVFLPESLQSGDSDAIEIDWYGFPQPAGFMGMDFQTHGPDNAPTLATLSEPFYARSWWPCKDTPEDKATVRMSANVPAGMKAASNGNLVSVDPLSSGDSTWIWEHNFPITTYGVHIAISNYVQWSEPYVSPNGTPMALDFLVFPEDEADARYDFARIPEMLDFFSSLFGEYPFAEDHYGMVEFKWGGAMEHQTMSSYGDFLITGDRFYERLVAHELAHQWWGNLITLRDWDALWLHEGFATFCEALWIEHTDGQAAYRKFLRKRSFTAAGFVGPVQPPVNLFNQTVYFKGAWVLHMLRGRLGDDAFFQFLNDYGAATALRFGNADTDDLIEVAERSSGEDLTGFFEQWLYRTGRPQFGYQWSSQPEGGQYRTTVQLRELESLDPWEGEVTIRFSSAAGDQDVTMAFDALQQSADFLLVSEPTGIEFDPDEWLLANFSEDVATDSPSLGNSLRLLEAVPNPFNPRTQLRFVLDQSQEVQLRILDSRGREVRRLHPGSFPAGQHSVIWDGRDSGGHNLGSGVYRILLQGKSATAQGSVTLLR